MNITVKTSDLKDAVGAAAGIVLPKMETHATLRVRSGALFVLVGRETAQYEAKIPTHDATKDAVVTVSVQRLAGVLGAISGQEVTLATRGKRLELRSGAVSVAIPTTDAAEADRADVGTPPETAARWMQLAPALAAVTHAICKDEARYGLMGAHVGVSESGSAVVATDGHRLAAVQVGGDAYALGPVAVTIPDWVVRLLSRIGRDSGLVWVEGSTVRYHDPLCTVIAPLVDASFPAWQQVVPKDSEFAIHAQVDSDALREAIEQARACGVTSLKTTWDTGAASVTLESHTEDADFTTVIDLAGSDTKSGHTKCQVALNPEYVRDALRALCGRAVAQVSIADAHSPVIVRPYQGSAELAGALAVVMPMRL
jgi:DNA polymerase III sliding clamp (beta) subunit (PCNA family)